MKVEFFSLDFYILYTVYCIMYVSYKVKSSALMFSARISSTLWADVFLLLIVIVCILCIEMQVYIIEKNIFLVIYCI